MSAAERPASYQPGDPVSWVGTRGLFDRPLVVDSLRAGRRGEWVYDLRDGAGDIVIYAAAESELMPAL